MSEENDDKPFEASEQKLRRAREKGDIPRSAELTVAAMYLGAWIAFAVGAGFAVKAWMTMATRALGSEGWTPGTTGAVAVALGQYAGWAVLGLAAVPSLVIVVALIAAYIARKTPLGRYIYAVGGNERGAALSGVKVNRIKFFVYMFSGLCAALVGLIISSQLVASHPATGQAFELNAIAAAVLGGTSMSGGRGRIGGTIIGAMKLASISRRPAKVPRTSP